MKTRSLLRALLLFPFLLAALPALAADNPIILPVDEPEASETHRVIWSTEPGIRYELQQSTDFVHWTTVDGFPIEGDGSTVKPARHPTAPARSNDRCGKRTLTSLHSFPLRFPKAGYRSGFPSGEYGKINYARTIYRRARPRWTERPRPSDI